MGLGLAILGALALAAGGQSARTLQPAQQQRALTIALNYWRARDAQAMPNGLPSCGQPQIIWARLDSGEGGAAVPATCAITVSSTMFTLPWEAPLVCETLLHEVGHLVLGLDHSIDPYNPMYGEIWRIVPACQHFTLPAPKHRAGIATGAG